MQYNSHLEVMTDPFLLSYKLPTKLPLGSILVFSVTTTVCIEILIAEKWNAFLNEIQILVVFQERKEELLSPNNILNLHLNLKNIMFLTFQSLFYFVFIMVKFYNSKTVFRTFWPALSTFRQFVLMCNFNLTNFPEISLS